MAQPDLAAALALLLGHPPHVLTGGAEMVAHWFETPLGGMIAIADDDHLHLLEFAERKSLPTQLRALSRLANGRIGLGRNPIIDRVQDQIAAYFAGTRAVFDLPLALRGTPFQARVWQALQQVPAGVTVSYGELARRIGQPTAVRAVARANGANQIAIVIPCHRIIGADGTMTGYAGGVWRKQALIRHETDRFGGQSAFWDQLA